MSESDPEQNEPPADSAWGHHSPPTASRIGENEPPATPGEFQQITGVPNIEPDALGVGITQAELHEHRKQDKAVSSDTSKDLTGSVPDPSKT